MELDEDQYLAHYGILRKSGRYPWGSGKDKEDLDTTFAGSIKMLQKRGLSEAEIARGFGITTTQMRAAKSIERNAKKQADINMAERLKDKGWSNVAIGERMGLNESSVRDLLAPGAKDKADILETTANMLKDEVAEKGYLDVGVGVEKHMNITRTKLSTAVARLKEEGYTVHYVKVEQLGTGKNTTMVVLAAPGTTYSEVYRNREQIQIPLRYSEDGGRSYDRVMPPLSIDSKRVAVRYAEQGGADADGVIYVRPGVKDVSLGSARYAQVRIAVDGSHYLKGMAMYKNDLPAGTDLMFNTNKKSTGNKLDAMKPMKDDPDNPFGASISRQIGEPGENGKKRLTSVMNIVNEEGNWEDWSKSLSSQMLSKQSPALAKTQLDMTFDRKKNELDTIRDLTSPAVKKKLLESFADDADSSAVHLKAAALPRQGSHVILPINSMKETEVYAPNFRDGERVVLIRYPHGGIFEIPELTVNNRHPEAKQLLGNAKDAIGIHSKVAERLSGADFDGDTVLVIPNDKRSIKTAPALEGLKGFDPKHSYPPYDGMRTMDGGTWSEAEQKAVFPEGKKPSSRVKGTQMGLVSNLITDMTLRGATNSELARAVRHSMVVIDAEKHSLDWKQSSIDNGIPQLMQKYQKRSTGGASTLISQAGARVDVRARKLRPESEGGPIDKATGKRVFVETGEHWQTKSGQIIYKEERSKRLAETDDAHTLSSGTPIEKIYADHSNRLKDLANTARREASEIKMTPYSPEARVKYADEVKSLEAKLNLALRNNPLERQAQVIGNAIFNQKKSANPDLEKDELKKLRAQALTEARIRTGAKKTRIEITDAEWEAIRAGAISTNQLKQILNNADLDKIKQLATPKSRKLMDESKINQAIAMLRNHYTQAEVADHLGVSVSTLKRSLSEGGE